MPLFLEDTPFPVSAAAAAEIWHHVQVLRNVADEDITVRCVSEEVIQQLNNQYRGKNKPTNVLTFSYPPLEQMPGAPEHDVCVCLPVIEREAQEKGVSVQEWAQWVLVHAFLHVTGMDHERSPKEKVAMEAAEKTILSKIKGVQ